MAEIKVTELPVMTINDFTPNDRFLVIDDGELKQFTRGTFHEWILANVRGEQGIQGVSGKDGLNGARGIDGLNGKDGLSAYQLAVANGFVGNQVQWEASLKGAKGVDGFNGWSPVLKTTARGSDTVLEITEWVGGTGVKPSTIGFLSSTGIVSDILLATNIRGATGDRGEKGITGATGATGADGVNGKTVSSLTFNSDRTATLSFTDATNIKSNVQPSQTGWGVYKDTQYTDVTPFTVAVNSQSVLPNNAITKIENLPDSVSTFYNPTTKKYSLIDFKGFYNIKVKFKVSANATAGNLNLSVSKETPDLVYSEDKPLRADNQIQEMVFNIQTQGDPTLTTNGATIQIRPYGRDVSIYGIEVTVAKVI